jgi:hypothetical protein
MPVEGAFQGEALANARYPDQPIYLQSDFQVDLSNVGIVAMKNSPPTGTERKTWDSICIVVLKKKQK